MIKGNNTFFKSLILIGLIQITLVFGQMTRLRIAIAEPYIPWLSSKYEKQTFSDFMYEEFEASNRVVTLDKKRVYDSTNDFEGDCIDRKCVEHIGYSTGAQAVVLTTIKREANSYIGSVTMYGTEGDFIYASTRIVHLGEVGGLANKIKEAPWKILKIDKEIEMKERQLSSSQKINYKPFLLGWSGLLIMSLLL